MTHPAWLVQIYEMTNPNLRDRVAELLAHVDGLAVETTQNGPDHFLIVQCSDEDQAAWVGRLVFSSDADAILLHTVHGPPMPIELAPFIPRPGLHSDGANGTR